MEVALFAIGGGFFVFGAGMAVLAYMRRKNGEDFEDQRLLDAREKENAKIGEDPKYLEKLLHERESRKPAYGPHSDGGATGLRQSSAGSLNGGRCVQLSPAPPLSQYQFPPPNPNVSPRTTVEEKAVPVEIEAMPIPTRDTLKPRTDEPKRELKRMREERRQSEQVASKHALIQQHPDLDVEDAMSNPAERWSRKHGDRLSSASPVHQPPASPSTRPFATPYKVHLQNPKESLGINWCAEGPDAPVQITDLEPKGAASRNGVQTSGFIVGVGNRPISCFSDMKEAFESLQSEGKTDFVIHVSSDDPREMEDAYSRPGSPFYLPAAELGDQAIREQLGSVLEEWVDEQDTEAALELSPSSVKPATRRKTASYGNQGNVHTRLVPKMSQQPASPEHSPRGRAPQSPPPVRSPTNNLDSFDEAESRAKLALRGLPSRPLASGGIPVPAHRRRVHDPQKATLDHEVVDVLPYPTNDV
ncbi:hypothetical protein DIPPA_27277 [Diplonema papillatum]|nr:hypothetical protein DIPPA_27277 [Diplonema papillatum]